jgi:pyruvate,water dikinase
MQGQFVAAARAASRYLAAREKSKMYCARVMDAGRSLVRELGQRFALEGALSRWQDVLLVTNQEADAFLADPGAFSGLIAQRAGRLEVLAAREPPFVFDGEAPRLPSFPERGSGEMRQATPGSELKGIGVSPGRYTGRARVINSLEAESELEPGDVIVAASTDASWGPLFLAAGAVVVETGAPISHAAIVARELGIPAAVSVTDATRRIPDRTIITVDGDTGVVTML